MATIHLAAISGAFFTVGWLPSFCNLWTVTQTFILAFSFAGWLLLHCVFLALYTVGWLPLIQDFWHSTCDNWLTGVFLYLDFCGRRAKRQFVSWGLSDPITDFRRAANYIRTTYWVSDGSLQVHCPAAHLPGPKSGRWWQQKIGWLSFAVLTGLLLLQSAAGGGEGCGWAMTTTETSSFRDGLILQHADVKIHGPRPEESFGPIVWPHHEKKVVKRSIRRAFRRAQRDGVCWYRGQCLTPQDFQFPTPMQQKLHPAAPLTNQRTRNDLRQCNASQQNRRYLRFLQWNTSGLSKEKLEEIKCWLSTQNADVVVLLETHWRFTSDWSDSEWHHIHSGDSENAGAGILLMVSKRVAKLQQLQWQEGLPGPLGPCKIGICNTSC